MLATLQPTVIVASDLSRAMNTAKPLARILGLEVTTDVGLRETFAGEWEGLTRPEMEQGYGTMLAPGSAVKPVLKWRSGSPRPCNGPLRGLGPAAHLW